VLADWTDGPLAHLPSGSFPRTLPGLPSRRSAQSAVRRRVPGQPRLRQGPRRPAAPRPHRRRRPHRPPRPRPRHLAPARRMAPRAGMDEPVRSRHRPTRHSGLTSPNPGHRTLRRPAAGHPPPSPEPGRSPQGRSRGARSGHHARTYLVKLRGQRSGWKMIYRNSSVIQAKSRRVSKALVGVRGGFRAGLGEQVVFFHRDAGAGPGPAAGAGRGSNWPSPGSTLVARMSSFRVRRSSAAAGSGSARRRLRAAPKGGGHPA
jgi:hypothetical protein